MDKGLLFQFMRVKFREAGFPPAEVELHMQSFTERYQNQSDEEIEADIRRRGGPTKIAAATVERRNTVLMADADYRAFVKTAQAKSAAEEKEGTAPAAVSADAAAETEAADLPQTAQKMPPEKEEDPLAAWFAEPAPKNETGDSLPPLFAEDTAAEQRPSDGEDAASATVQMPAVKPAEQTAQAVHTIPLFGNAPEHADVLPQKKSPAPMPPRPAADADLGRTKVIRVPAQEQPAAQNSAPPARRDPASAEAYRKEQQAIWNAPQNVRDTASAPRPQAAKRTSAAPTQQRNRPQPPKAEKQIEYADRGNVTRLQEKTYWGEGSEEGVKRFRIVMAVSVPFVIVLLLAYAVIALGLIALMAVLIAAFIVGLVVEVAAGSLVALVAVIYGVSQLFIVMPIGMFELGLGVAAIGITMFVGILMYNVAVRLLPFLLRKFIGFQSIFRGFLQDLYYYVKGECYRR